jgi:geranylgeranyl pyrophosphate synthase
VEAEHTDIADALAAFARRFDAAMDACLAPHDDDWPELTEAMRYSALLPGKRIRPFLTVRACELCGGDAADAMPAALAVELVHCFTLVHDDLPAMDDDDLRRGQPTCHKKFGEALAILAGDALLALAFETLATRATDPAVAAGWVAELAVAVGRRGTIAGQAADIRGETRPPDRALVETIHQKKTARLIEAACRLGAVAAHAKHDRYDAIGRYGREVGLAFQIADDLLDVAGTSHEVGNESRRLADAAVARAVSALAGFGAEADDLRKLAGFVVNRRH